MRKTLALTMFGLIMGVFLLAAGCSDDKATTPGTPGDPNDPGFQFVDSVILGDQFMEGMGTMMEMSFMLMDSIPGALARNHNFRQANAAFSSVVFDTLSYSYAGGWHVFYFEAYLTDIESTDTVDVVGIDSIQVLADGVPMTVPDSTANAIYFRAHVTVDTRVEAFSASMDHSFDLVADPTDPAVAIINGSALEAMGFTFEDSASVCDISVSNSISANNVKMNLDVGGCPEAGSITAMANLNMNCTGSLTLNVDGTWNVGATFEGDLITVNISNGENYWTMTDTCGTGPVAGSRWW